MNFISVFLACITSSIELYGSELIGAFLMASLINLIKVKGSQRESFDFLSMGFYALIFRDLALIASCTTEYYFSTIPYTPYIIKAIDIIGCAITVSFFIVAALKNIKLYFSTSILMIILSSILSGGIILFNLWPTTAPFAPYIQNALFAIAFLIVSCSFYLRGNSKQNTVIRSTGAGFFVLGFCYIYLTITLFNSPSLALLISYGTALLLTLAAQIQFLNLYISKLKNDLCKEKDNRKKIWDISPFPIIISRLRDDSILYMNSTARQVLFVDKDKTDQFPFSAYFLDSEKRIALNQLISQEKIVHSFDAQLKNPLIENTLWADLSARVIDYDEEITLYTTFKDITERKKLALILKEQASTDPLTNLYNRRQFELLANQSLRTAERYGSPFSLGMIDIDFFKKVNDTYGHEAGDLVLTNLAHTLKATLRKSDIIARYGGEEFVIFFSQTAPEGGIIAAEHLRAAVENMHTIFEGKQIPVTISIGISGCDTMKLPILIKQADEALYYSKENGRNQVTLFQDLHSLKSNQDDIVLELRNPVGFEDKAKK